MKSAYEIAMERLEQANGPSRKLTDEQRARIADINAAYDAKIAQLRLRNDQKLSSTSTAEEAREIQSQFADELAALEDRREREKDAVWNDASE